MSVRGVLAPIIVRSEGDVFVIVAGERRYRAAKLAGIDTIPARIYQLTDNESAEITLTENVGREDLNPIDLAHGFQDLMNRLGITGKELARRVGVDATTVTRTIRLLRLPDDIRRQIASGEVSSHVAREVARIPDETTQRHVLKKARRNSLTGTQTEELVRSVVGNKRPSRPRRKDKTLSFPLEGGRTWRVLVKPKTTYAELEQDVIQLLEEIRTRRSARVSID